MTTLYTAVGRFKRKTSEKGRRYPVVIVSQREYMVDFPEMIIWICLNWNILNFSQICMLYEQKLQEAKIAEYAPCENYIRRLIQRGLIVSGVGAVDHDALSNLLCDLYIIPATSSLFAKISVFLRFVLLDKMPFYKAKIIFEKEMLSDSEKRVLALAKRSQLSTAEIIKHIETDTKQSALLTISNLYLRKLIIFDKM